MSFIWPSMLLLLLLVPVLIGGYVVLQRRRARAAADLGALGFAQTGDGSAIGRRRHVPFVIFMTAITLLIAGFSRPEMIIDLPRVEGTVILAIDNSNSMLATDVDPAVDSLGLEGETRRVDVAKSVALDFAEQQPSTVRIGIVTFGEGAAIVQPPTDDRLDLTKTIERLTPGGATSIGQGLFTSLSAVTGEPIAITEEAIETGDITALDIGYHSSAVIVLLTDGENTDGNFDPTSVAELAANAGIRIFPIGFGSTDGTVFEVDGFSMATSLNEPQLMSIAETSDGEYLVGSEVVAIDEIYDSIDLKLTVRGDEMEITSLLAAAAALLLIVGAGLSMVWFGRAP